jgi:hypothetical protein
MCVVNIAEPTYSVVSTNAASNHASLQHTISISQPAKMKSSFTSQRYVSFLFNAVHISTITQTPSAIQKNENPPVLSSFFIDVS